MKKIVLFTLFAALAFVGCQKKEEAPPQVVYNSVTIKTPQEIKQLEDIAKSSPANVNAWIVLGNALMDSSRFGEAADAYQKALALDPKNVDVRVDMGTCLRGIGKYDKAAEEYRKAMQLNPGHPNAHRNLGVVLAFDMNNPKAGLKEFEKYVELAPNAVDTAEVQQTIKQLKAIP